MERAYEAGAGPELKEEDRDNSIFVSAFKRHLQSGSLKERLDTLLTDAAAGKHWGWCVGVRVQLKTLHWKW